MVAGRDQCKRVITVRSSVDDSQHSVMNNTLQCSLFHYVLAHLQSGDYVNMISSSVSLLTMIELNNINIISIREQGNNIVLCNNTGGVSCNNCSDVVIEGITWDQCGDPHDQRFIRKLNGGIIFYTISNLTIHSCTFQHSKVRALTLVAV